MKLIKCCKCMNKIATWCYIPGGLKNGDFYCDDCVPRGCSCNQYHINEFNDEDDLENKIYWNSDLTEFTKEKTLKSIYYEPVDKQGRQYPCCEFDYNEDGYDYDNLIDEK